MHWLPLLLLLLVMIVAKCWSLVQQLQQEALHLQQEALHLQLLLCAGLPPANRKSYSK
jgi:hypothetical protein